VTIIAKTPTRADRSARTSPGSGSRGRSRKYRLL
jgi:hypothetical protein